MKGTLLVILSLLVLAPAKGQTFTDSNLPLINIVTGGQPIVDEPETAMTMSVYQQPNGGRNALTDVPVLSNLMIGIEIRGSSSQQVMLKKSYGFEIWSSVGVETDTSLLGMPAESDWILYASHNDKTFLRNVLSFELYRRMGNYAARTQHVELFLDGQYQGLYVLMEKIKRDNDRVDIAKLRASDTTGLQVTGGYIIKADRYGGNNNGGFATNFFGPNLILLYEYPMDTVIHPLQTAYLVNYMDSFGSALYSQTFTDPILGYRNYADVNSFIDFLLINELAKNPDTYGYSTFLVKPKNNQGRKLRAGPPWDLDIAWKNTYFLNADNPSGFMYNYAFNPLGWWDRMMQDPQFQTDVACRWQAFRQNQFLIANIHQYIDSMAAYLNESQQRNFALWPVLGQDVFINLSPYPLTYQAEINVLKNWVSTRIFWLDSQFSPNCLTLANEEVAQAGYFTLYPVPAVDEVMIQFGEVKTGMLEVYDASGRMLLQQAVENASQAVVPLSGLATGYYIVKFLGTTDETFSRPLLKY